MSAAAAPPAAAATSRSAAREGVTVVAPLIAGYAPYAFAIGAVIAASADPLAAWSGSWLIFGGSAHLATLRSLTGSGLLVAVLTGAVVNARLLVYSTSLAGRWRGQPLWFRLAAAPLVIDPTWAVTEARGSRDGTAAEQRRFFAAAGLTLGAAWSAMIAAGVAFGGRLDAEHLAVGVPLCLASVVGPRLAARDTRLVCAAAGVVAHVATGLPAGSGLLVAVAAGCVAGALAGEQAP
jgi:predicted branched-subunit amino acid permease